MTTPIDVAYVEIVARTKDLRREIKDIADDDTKKLQKSFDEATKQIDKDFVHTAGEADKTFTKIGNDGRNAARRVETTFHESLSSIERHMLSAKDHVRSVFNRIDDDAHTTERRLRNRFFVPIENAFRSMSRAASNAFGNILSIFGSLGGAVGGHPFAALIIAIIPPIIALAAALKNLIGFVGLLPAGIAFLIAAVAPAIVAFQNFGDAMSAIASGDAKKMDEALKKLAPSARTVAKELGALIPILKDLQIQVQQAFFQPLIGQFTQLARVLSTPLKNGMTLVASALGNLVARLIGFFSLSENVTLIEKLFQSTARIINAFAGPLVDFFIAMGEAVTAGLPFLERFFGAIDRFLESFSQKITNAARGGGLADFIEKAFTVTKELFGLLRSIGGFLATLFQGTEQSGHDLIITLTEMFDKLNAFLKTKEGQDALRELVLLVKFFGKTLMSSIELLISAQVQFSSFIRILERIGRGFVGFIKKIGDFFSKLPDQIGAFMSRIPAAIGEALQMGIDTLLVLLGTFTGAILFFLTGLPRMIGEFIAQIPQKIHDGLSGGGNVLNQQLQKWMTDALGILQKGWNDVITFIMSVPDKLRGIGPAMLAAGKHLIESFKDGFKRAGTFVADIAGDIVTGIRGFINKAIDKINDGIEIVEKAINRLNASLGLAGMLAPGVHLGRIPHLAKGAIVRARPGGVLANVAEGGEDEVVSPLSKLKALIGAGISFGPGAIVINFNGQTPSLSEARSIGQQVGNGILSVLERNQIQAAVRAG